MTPDEEFAAKQLAQVDLYFFSRWMFLKRRKYKWIRAAQHKAICDALMRVFRGECKRLIINVPPRYSKTELVVVNFIAWALGLVPDAEFIHTTYATPLALNNSEQTRDVIRHEAYQEIFPGTKLASEGKGHWKTTEGGVMYATGSGGTITGFGAGKHREGFGGAIIIDDPHKPDEVKSDVIRKGVLDWFQNTLESRKNSPETPIILIMQRLHEYDLAGFLLDGGNGEEWEHVCLSAWQYDDEGNDIPLWPEKHDAETLRRMERANPYVFAGQYRQMPSPPDGGTFKPDNITIVDAIPVAENGKPFVIKWVRGWDFASTSDGDFTAGGKLGLLPDGRLIIADMVRDRMGPDQRDAVLVNTAISDTSTVKVSIPQDPGQAGKTQVMYLVRRLAGFNVHTSPETGSKENRADPLASQINVGNVLMLRSTWNKELVDEMRLFPNGNFDDQVDSLSRAYAALLSQSDFEVEEFHA